MSLKRVLALLLLTTAALSPAAWAQRKDDEEAEDTEDAAEDQDEGEAAGDEEDAADDADDDEGEAADDDEGEAADDDEGSGRSAKATKRDEPFVKQNLSGHDLGTNKKESQFEKDRFFVDKVDTSKTAKGTLIQGSLASSSFAFTEVGGGPYNGNEALGENQARFSRLFTELRLQTDFRHIAASRWEARVDARARMVSTPTDGAVSADPTRIQSGFDGTNEYDLRELWLFRSGKRSDLFIGRQFVPDLGGVKFDGLRIDYARSRALTFIGFGGLYPLRGSRSVTTDYEPLKTNEGESAGRFVGAGGFGAAYRTDSMYGAVGGVALVPLAGEQARVFVTSTGYYRSSSALDVYHFALVDLTGTQGFGVTNLSAGVNYKPGPRLRVTANVHRNDVDTLNVQANAFLNEPNTTGAGATVVDNETYFRRLATNVGRVGVSAGLGELQRFEVSTQLAYRYRPEVAIPVGDGTMPPITLQRTQGVDVYASVVDRRSFKGLRLGADGWRSFGVGGDDAVAFNRSEVLALRAFASRELANGHGEWDAEISYATTQDAASGTDCATVYTCYGSSSGTILSLGGNLYYRINRDWFAQGMLYLSRQTLTYGGSGTPTEDPTVTGLTGYLRAAYRF